MTSTTLADYQRLQRHLAGRMARELAAGSERQRKTLRGYYLEYVRDVGGYDRLATKDELLRRVAASRVVLGGDYHSLDQSKKTHLRILRRLTLQSRTVVLGLECLPSAGQADVDAYLGGTIDEPTLLGRVDYRRTWGFPWEPYRELLDLARSRGFHVLALNGPPGTPGSRLSARDRHMAQRIAAAATPDRLVYVVVGDWHLARGHLPARTAEAGVAPAGLLLIHQNSDAIYWKLASRGLEQATDVVLVRPGSYCVVNATPFVKLASYALWEGHGAQAARLAHEGILASSPGNPVWVDDAHTPDAQGDDALDAEIDLADTFSLFVNSIAEVFELGPVPADVTILPHDEQNLMHRLVRELHSRDEDFLHEVAVLMLNNRSFYVPGIRTVYLGTLSLNALSDMAARYVYHTLSRSRRLPLDPRRAFYARVMREAVTFLGAKAINPKRPYKRRADYEDVLRPPHRRDLLGPAVERTLVAQSYLKHRRLEKRALVGGQLPGPAAAVYHLKPIIRYGVTRGLGQALGGKLHAALVRGLIPRDELRRLFLEDWCRRVDPAARYLGLVRATRRQKPGTPERSGRL